MLSSGKAVLEFLVNKEHNIKISVLPELTTSESSSSSTSSTTSSTTTSSTPASPIQQVLDHLQSSSFLGKTTIVVGDLHNGDILGVCRAGTVLFYFFIGRH